MQLLITISLWWLGLGTLTWFAVWLGYPRPFSLGMAMASVMVVLLWPAFVVAFVAGYGRRV